MGYLCCRKDTDFEEIGELRYCQNATDGTQTFEKINTFIMWKIRTNYFLS